MAWSQVLYSRHVPAPNNQGGAVVQEGEDKQGLETKIVCAQWKEALLFQGRSE